MTTSKPPLLRRVWYWLLALPPLLVLGLGTVVLQSDPVVAVQAEISSADVQRALQLLRAHDPRRAVPGRVQMLQLEAREIELVLNHGGQRWAAGASRVSLKQGEATLQFSLHLERWLPSWLNASWLPLGRWLNAEVRLLQTSTWPTLDAVTVGSVPIPVWIAQPLALHLLARLELADELPLLAELVRRVRFQPGRLQVVYAWQTDIAERMLGALLPAQAKQRNLVYVQRLAAVLKRQRPGPEVSMADLLGPLLALAVQRSAAGEDAALENRALIVVLTTYLNGRGIKAVLPPSSVPALRPMRVVLAGRDDWPRHFIVSAALAAESSGPLSYALGLYKEVADARGGSGFSFNDMAANRAGTRFGELALSRAESLHAAVKALTGQRLEPTLRESDFMPPADDLAEFMPEAEFVRRYGGVGAPAYQQQMAEIERRVAELPLLRSGR